MLENFIYAKEKSLFEEVLNNGEILDEAIVFIEDTKEIWNHGTYFGGSEVDLSNIELSIENILNTKLDNISDLETIRSGAAKGATALQSYTEKYTGTYSKPSGGIPKSDLASAVQTSLGKADTALQTHQDISGKADKSSLAAVATSGSYNDLTGKPTIPSEVTESTISGWGFTKNTGTITGISANGTSVATSGVANIPAANTSKYGVTKLSSATNSTSTSLAATASAVKSAYDLANGRQEKLVSGTNVKTINGVSILGSGNLEIGGSSAYPRVDHGATNTTFSLSPNTFYVWDEVASLNLSFTSGNESVTNEYLFQFVSGGIPATLSLPDGIQWIGGEPSIEANKTYQVSILNGIGVIASVGASVRMIQFVIERYINGPDLYSCENGMTWKQWVNSEYNTSGWEDAGNTISLGFDYVLDIYIDDVIIEDHTYTCEFND